MTSITHALKTSSMDNYNVLYAGLSMKTVQKLQLAQNTIVWLLANMTPYFSSLVHKEHLIYRTLNIWYHPYDPALVTEVFTGKPTPSVSPSKLRWVAIRNRSSLYGGTTLWNSFP